MASIPAGSPSGDPNMWIKLLVVIVFSSSVVMCGKKIPNATKQTTRASTKRPTTPFSNFNSYPTQTTEQKRYPCSCSEGTCNCCTGYILDRFNVTSLRSKVCAIIQYEPDEFEFNVKLVYNERRIYQTTIAGKNPQPVCLPLRRIIPANLCVRFSNVYMIGRNLHLCVDFEGQWNDVELFAVSFDCLRVGANGISAVKPEDGGGLPLPTSPQPIVTSDYDDSA